MESRLPKHYEKNKQLSIPDDINKFKTRINETLSESVTALKSNPNDATAYRDLVESTYGATLLLNRRRISELQCSTVSTYVHQCTRILREWLPCNVNGKWKNSTRIHQVYPS